MTFFQDRIKVFFQSFQGHSGGSAFSFSSVVEYGCNTPFEFECCIICGMNQYCASIRDPMHDKMPFELGTVTLLKGILSFRNTRSSGRILSPRQFNGFANFSAFQQQDAIGALTVAGSEEQKFHGYGVPETNTICRALNAPFFNS